LAAGHGVADYLLFVDRQAVGVLEAKKVGTSLIGVETQSGKYVTGLPDVLFTPVRPLPFAYESTGAETRFTNRLDPVPRSREVHWFHRPETLQGWLARITGPTPTPMFRAGVRAMPPLDRTGLRPAQFDAITKLEQSLAHDRAHRAGESQDHGTGMGPNCPAPVSTARHRPTCELPADLHNGPARHHASLSGMPGGRLLIRGLGVQVPRGAPF